MYWRKSRGCVRAASGRLARSHPTSLELQEVGCLFCLLYDIRRALPHMGNTCCKETQVASCSTSWAFRKPGANPAPMLREADSSSSYQSSLSCQVCKSRPDKTGEVRTKSFDKTGCWLMLLSTAIGLQGFHDRNWNSLQDREDTYLKDG